MIEKGDVVRFHTGWLKLILENMNTDEVVKDNAWKAFFTLGPARITSAVQAIINPIAIR